MENNIDIVVENQGSMFTFQPLTEAGQNWIDENVASESWQWLGGRLCVDHRYAHDLAEGMLNDGLNVQ